MIRRTRRLRLVRERETLELEESWAEESQRLEYNPPVYSKLAAVVGGAEHVARVFFVAGVRIIGVCMAATLYVAARLGEGVLSWERELGGSRARLAPTLTGAKHELGEHRELAGDNRGGPDRPKRLR